MSLSISLICSAHNGRDYLQSYPHYVQEDRSGSGLGLDVTPIRLSLGSERSVEYGPQELRSMDLPGLISVYKVAP